MHCDLAYFLDFIQGCVGIISQHNIAKNVMYHTEIHFTDSHELPTTRHLKLQWDNKIAEQEYDSTIQMVIKRPACPCWLFVPCLISTLNEESEEERLQKWTCSLFSKGTWIFNRKVCKNFLNYLPYWSPVVNLSSTISGLFEFFLNDFHWIWWIQWIKTKSKSTSMVTRDTPYLTIDTFQDVVVKKIFLWLSPGHITMDI